jgi:hypothetical protein
MRESYGKEKAKITSMTSIAKEIVLIQPTQEKLMSDNE